MIQVRRNVFETNSSSSHSLVIKPGCDYYTPEEVFEELQWICEEVEGKPGKYILCPHSYEYDEGFNRAPFQVLDTFRTKLWYLYAHAPCRKIPPKGNRNWTRYQPEYYKVTNYIKKYLPWLEGLNWPSYDREKPHSEAYGFSGAMKKAGLDWYNYLFNKNIIVICDGDEYRVWERLKKTGLVKYQKATQEYTYD